MLFRICDTAAQPAIPISAPITTGCIAWRKIKRFTSTRVGAQRHADADLAHPPAHRIRDHAVDTHARQQHP